MENENVVDIEELEEMLTELEDRIDPIMVHIRVWQFGLTAGLSPREIAANIAHLTDQPEDNINVVEAITAYAIWGNKPELHDADDHLGSVEFNAWRGVVEKLKKEGFQPEEVADVVQHDFEVSAGLHTCDLSYVEKLRENTCEK